MKFWVRLILVVSLFSVLTLSVLAQSGEPIEELKPNQPKTFSISAGGEKSFTVNLKKESFAEFSWLANNELNLDFSLYSPTGKDLFENLNIIDSIPFVAPADGLYKFVVKLGEGKRNEETKISGTYKVTVRYTNVFKIPPQGIVKSSRKINGYDIKIVESKNDEGFSMLTIEKAGKLKAILKGDKFAAAGFYLSDDATHAYSPAEKRSAVLMRTTLDKTGEGTPDVAVEYYSGGAHCCFELYFFELGETVKSIKPLSTGDARTIAVGKNPKGGLRLETGDTSFAYWNISFAGSPIPKVVLTFKNGEFRPDFEAMKKPAPPLATLQKKARAERAKMNTVPYRGFSFAGLSEEGYAFEEAFWDEMLNLIYTGHEKLAWQYLDLAWRPDKPGKSIFAEDFKERLSESAFWRMIQEDLKTKK